jgi:vancomycin permeability regulator SanA
MRREKRKLYLEKRKLHRQKRKEKRRFYAQKKRAGFSPLAAILACLTLIVLGTLIAAAAINAAVIGSASDNIRDFSAEEEYGVAVVFGAKVHEGGTLSAMLEDRMSAAVALYREGKVKKLLVSGDGRGEWSETKYMKLYAIENGVAEADIIEDGEGFSTIETVTRAKEVFGFDKCVLVTQKYHLYRAIYAAESMEMDVVGVNSDPRKYAGQFFREVREVLARVKDFALCISK